MRNHIRFTAGFNADDEKVLDLEFPTKIALLVSASAALEVFIARELYRLSLDDWQHLTSTFTFGSGPTKDELDEIIRQSLSLWQGGPDEALVPAR